MPGAPISCCTFSRPCWWLTWLWPRMCRNVEPASPGEGRTGDGILQLQCELLRHQESHPLDLSLGSSDCNTQGPDWPWEVERERGKAWYPLNQPLPCSQRGGYPSLHFPLSAWATLDPWRNFLKLAKHCKLALASVGQ